MDGKLLAKTLFEINAIKFGTFTIKSGRQSPYYIDLRVLPSHPEALSLVGKAIAELIQNSNSEVNRLCGIPLAGIAIVTSVGAEAGIPSIYTRKEPSIYKELVANLKKMSHEKFDSSELPIVDKVLHVIEEMGNLKSHGIKRLVDGEMKNNDVIGIVDDVVTDAGSKIEARDMILAEAANKKLNVTVKDVFVLIDREEGGSQVLSEHGMKLHSAAKISDIVNWLAEQGLLSSLEIKNITDYMSKWRK